jgi:hypothetical protein
MTRTGLVAAASEVVMAAGMGVAEALGGAVLRSASGPLLSQARESATVARIEPRIMGSILVYDTGSCAS